MLHALKLPEPDDDGRFGPLNLPKSLAEALVRLDEIQTTEQQITVQLEYSVPDDWDAISPDPAFPEEKYLDSDQRFHRWKKKAMSALAHTKAERIFLQEYLRGLYTYLPKLLK